MSRDDVRLTPEFLIGKVRGYNCLYNPSNVCYKSKRSKNLCWEKIGQECSLDASVVKNKWKSLRDRYVRERKAEKLAEKTGTVAPRKEWGLYRNFAFLDPYLSSYEYLMADPAHGAIKRELYESHSEDSSAVADEDSIGHFLDMHSYSKPVHLSSPIAPPSPATTITPVVKPPMATQPIATQHMPTQPMSTQPMSTQPMSMQPMSTQPFVYILPAPATNPQPPQVMASSSPQITASPPNMQLEPPTKRARTAKNMNSSHIEKRFLRYGNQHGLEESEEYTSDEMFVLSLVPNFNKLTEAKKDKLKLDMHKLVYDAVYGGSNQ